MILTAALGAASTIASNQAQGVSGAATTTWTKMIEFTGAAYRCDIFRIYPSSTYGGELRIVADGTTIMDSVCAPTGTNFLVGYSFTQPANHNQTGPVFASSSIELWGRRTSSSFAFSYDYLVHEISWA